MIETFHVSSWVLNCYTFSMPKLNIVETITANNPAHVAVDALIEAGIPEHEIDWDTVGEVRRVMNREIDPATGLTVPFRIFFPLSLPPECR